MIEQNFNLIEFSVTISLVMLAISTVCALYRMMAGPSLPDRVLSIDLMAMIAISNIALFSIYSDEPVFLDVAIALALVIFLGTVAFARYLEKGLLQ